MNGSDALSRLRQPAYTGENRCLPCTVVNVLLAALLSLLLSVVLTPLVGLLAFGTSLGLVYLRGYLIPGTPELTKTYFPPWLLRLFGKETIETTYTATTATRTDRAVTDVDAPTDAEVEAGTNTDALTDTDIDAGTNTDAGIDVDGSETMTASRADDPLVEAGVVTPDGRSLTDSFQSAWTERLASASTDDIDPADVAAVYDADEARNAGPNSWVLDGSKSVYWGSDAALVADVAAAALLTERLDEWDDIDRDHRQSLLEGLRLCLDRCPACEGTVSHTEDRVDPCCQKPHLVADVTCDDCGAALADAAVVDDGTTDTVRERLLAL